MRKQVGESQGRFAFALSQPPFNLFDPCQNAFHDLDQLAIQGFRLFVRFF